MKIVTKIISSIGAAPFASTDFKALLEDIKDKEHCSSSAQQRKNSYKICEKLLADYCWLIDTSS